NSWAGSEDDIPPPPPPLPPPSQTPTQQTPHTISTIKLLILKKGEYDIWAMKMKHYLAYTDYPIWEVIQRGNGLVSISTDINGLIKVLPPKTAEEILAREKERKARTTLLMALPEDHLAKFYKMTDAKEMWEAIKPRFGGNDESKKMQKYILKQQFEGFSISNSEGLHKGYDRFQSLLSQLEIHGAGVSTEDANQKFLRSLPSAWSQVSLIMRTKPGVDSLSFDDLYNNLRVFESDVKGSTTSSFSTQNVAFVSENTSSTNDVNRSSCKQEDSKALVTLYGEGVDWTNHSEDEHEIMAFSSDSEVSNDSFSLKSCLETVELLKSQNDKLLKDLKKSELMVLETLSSKEEPKVVRKNDNAPIIEEWVSDDEEEDVSQPKIEKKTVKPSIVKKEFVKSKQQKNARKTVKQGNHKGFFRIESNDSGCSRHMTGNMSYLINYEETDGGYVAFGETPKGGKIHRNVH
ncbi:hypothetical protein Tco_0765685, partial [Tanacetum coccineum]